MGVRIICFSNQLFGRPNPLFQILFVERYTVDKGRMPKLQIDENLQRNTEVKLIKFEG